MYRTNEILNEDLKITFSPEISECYQRGLFNEFDKDKPNTTVSINENRGVVKVTMKNKPFLRDVAIGKSRCHEEDNFDEKIGLEIASKRALIKVNNKKINDYKKRIKYKLSIINDLEIERKKYTERIEYRKKMINNIKEYEIKQYLDDYNNGTLSEEKYTRYPSNPKKLNYKFKNFNNKVIKCIITADDILCNTETVGVSVCREGDKFNEEVGKTIAYKRALVKLSNKRMSYDRSMYIYNTHRVMDYKDEIRKLEKIIKKTEKRNNKLLNDIKKY